MPLSVTATTIRASGRSLKNAITAFKNARKQANKTRDAYDADDANVRRSELEEELADTASVIRGASCQGLEHFNLLTLVESAEKLISEDSNRQAIVLPSDAPLGAAPRRMPAAPASDEVPLIDFDLPASWVVPRAGEGAMFNDAAPAAPNDAAAPPATGAAAAAPNGNARVLSPIIQVLEDPGTPVPSSPGSLNSWETRSRASRDDILSQHEREAALIDDEEEAFSLSSEREALLRRTQLRLDEITAREKELAKRRHFQERRRQNDAARDDAMSQRSSLSDQESYRSTRTRASVQDIDETAHLPAPIAPTIRSAVGSLVSAAPPPALAALNGTAAAAAHLTPAVTQVRPPNRVPSVVVTGSTGTRTCARTRATSARQPVQPAPTPHASPQVAVTPSLAASIRPLAPPTPQRRAPRPLTPLAVSPVSPTTTWVHNATARTHSGRLSGHSPSRGPTTADIISSTASAAASAAAAAAVAAVAGHQPAASPLEAVKLAERRRPAEKFNGVSKEVDFEDHLRQFKRAVNLPGLTADEKLTELRHWFSGLALIQVSGYLRRQDAAAAFDEAIVRLNKEYGQRAETAEEMLAGVLRGEAIERENAEATNEFICKVERVYSLALETDRDRDFDRKSLMRTILGTKLPFLLEKWSYHVSKNTDKILKFGDFLGFLAVQKRAATELQEAREGFTLVTRHKPQKAKVHATRVEEVPPQVTKSDTSPSPKASSYAAVAAKPASQRRPVEQRRPLKCSFCFKEHWLSECPSFPSASVDEKRKFLGQNRCRICAGKHEIEECRFPGKCETCGKRHRTCLHEISLKPASAAPATKPAPPASNTGTSQQAA